MKKKGNAGLGMMIPKRMRMAGMTFYLRNGQLVGRESSTHEKRSNTLPQFVQRQYTTEEALQTAADSYGGLTGTPFLSPR